LPDGRLFGDGIPSEFATSRKEGAICGEYRAKNPQPRLRSSRIDKATSFDETIGPAFRKETRLDYEEWRQPAIALS
jgi:hypothetical protein